MNPQKIIKIKQQIAQLSQAKDFAKAAQLAKKLTDQNPQDIEAWWVQGQLLLRIGHLEDALHCLYQSAGKPSPIKMQALNIILDVSASQGMWPHGIPAGRDLLAANPGSVEISYKLGLCWHGCSHYENAINCFQTVLDKEPKHPEVLSRMAMAHCYLGENEKGLEYLRKSLREQPSNKRVSRHFVTSHNYLDQVDEAEVAKVHLEAGAEYQKLAEAASSLEEKERAADKKLRIGFCSEDFKRHSVPYFLLPILRAYDRSNWEVFCYADVAKPDDISEEIQSLCDVWVDCRQLSHEQLLSRIREDEIDVLFDLMAYFGEGRYEMFAQRAAPVQINYLGYPNTTGLPNMDFRLVDQYTDPGLDELYSEALIRLPHSFICFEPDHAAPEVAELPVLKKGSVTFGSFNAAQKISERCIRLWSEILQQVPNSKLLIKATSLQEEAYQDRLSARFEKHGIDRSRLALYAMMPKREDHLGLYAEVDIHLDTFPYHGTTTTCEALWQGVPSVTLAGETHRSRVGVSILRQVGLDDWIAESDEDYVAIAVRKAANLEDLASCRSSMRERVKPSPLMDADLMISDLDSAFREMLSKKC